MFDILNAQSPNIKFTREKPSEKWLAFLNVEVYLANGTYRTRWFRKPSNKNILVHYRSAHPRSIKGSVISNMFKTARKVSSGPQERTASLELASCIAISNGYARVKKNFEAFLVGAQLVRRTTRAKSPCLHFVADDLSRAIRACLHQFFKITLGL